VVESVLWVCVTASTSMSMLLGASCVLPVKVGGGGLWLSGRDEVWAEGVGISVSAVRGGGRIGAGLAGLRSVGRLGRCLDGWMVGWVVGRLLGVCGLG
jgi:hypothetical protein